MRKKQPKTEYVYRSGLARQIKGFLEEKRRLGFKYIREELELQNLDRFCEQYKCKDCLPQELVLAWTEQKPHQSAQTIAFKASVIRGLAAFMQRNRLEAYLLPWSSLPKQTHDHTPYIFSHEEISRLFRVIDAIPYNPVSPKRCLIYPLLFRFLYCCGLRISEALNLKLENVDIKNGVLEILDAKAYRDRLVPLDPMLRERCEQYIRQMFPIAEPGQFFFPAPDGKPYHVFTVRKSFRDLMWKAGISYHGRNIGPRLHDIRYPNLNKIQTFLRKYLVCSKYRLKRFGFYFYLFLLIPQKSTREPSGFFHFADTFLSFSSSRVASAFAFSSAVMSR